MRFFQIFGCNSDAARYASVERTDYSFELYYGTKEELLKVLDELDEDFKYRYQQWFPAEWLSEGQCDHYMLMVEYISPMDTDMYNHPGITLLSQRMMRAYMDCIRHYIQDHYFELEEGLPCRINNFWDCEAYQASFIEEEDR